MSSMAMVVSMRRLFGTIICGQVISFIISGTNIFITLTHERNLNTEFFPNQIVYHVLLLIALIFSRRSFAFYRTLPAKMFFLYGVLGCVDFAANVAVLKSFQYTSAISVMVFSSTSTIFVMVFTIAIFGRRYNFLHGIGAFIVAIGIFLINYSRYLDEDTRGDVGWMGMFLASMAAIGYAISNVVNEYVSRTESGYPFGALGAMGLSGSIISFIICQATPYGWRDRDMVLSASLECLLFIGGFVGCMVIFYVVVPVFIQQCGAVQLNLNIITADLIVLVFNLIHKEIAISWVYMSGFISVIVGMVVFNLTEPVDRRDTFVLTKSAVSDINMDYGGHCLTIPPTRTI
uniref:EamA domain-containing protein n=1 Tax=Spongospora subterranea TaxID=70186 RepID=A0A0H5RMG4_9EUKA|eukprot:CRZ09909.1 hypothetical protein [Spongospora subterranea]